MKIIIAGAGISGLSLARELKEHEIILFEKNKHVGGLASSFRYKNFILDIGPHKLYSQIPGIMEDFGNILGEDRLIIKKKNSIRLMGKYFSFPVNPKQVFKNLSPEIMSFVLKAGFDFIITALKSKKAIKSYEDYFLAGFGRAAYEAIFRDYAVKVWGDPRRISFEIAKRRVPIPKMSGFLNRKGQLSADYFYYPVRGIGQLCEKLLASIKNNTKLLLETELNQINITRGKLTSVSLKRRGKIKEITADFFISTLYLHDLVERIKPAPPEEVFNALKHLNYVDYIITYLFIPRERVLNDNWLFFPEKEYIFNRVYEQKSFSRWTCPDGWTCIGAGITKPQNDSIFQLPDKEIYELVRQDLVKAEILKKGEEHNFLIKKVRRVYPIYSLNYKKHLNIVMDYLTNIPNLLSVGRNGMFNYNNMDHSLDMAKIIANYINNGCVKEDWELALKRFDSYKIVD